MKIRLVYLLLTLGGYTACKHDTEDLAAPKPPELKAPVSVPAPPGPPDPRDKYVGKYKGEYKEGYVLVNTNSMGFLTGYEKPVIYDSVSVSITLTKDTNNADIMLFTQCIANGQPHNFSPGSLKLNTNHTFYQYAKYHDVVHLWVNAFSDSLLVEYQYQLDKDVMARYHSCRLKKQ